MTNPHQEIGTNFKMTFPKRMMLYVLLDLILINLICYYGAYKVPLDVVIGVIIIEIAALGIAFAFWVPRYQLNW